METTTMPNCPLCHSENVPMEAAVEPSTNIHICNVCGKFKVTEDAGMFGIPRLSDKERILLSGLARERSDIAHKNPKKRSLLIIRHGEIESLIELAPKSVSEKAMKLLAAIERETPHFGSEITLNPATAFSLAYAINHTECFYLLTFLKEQEFIEFRNDSDGYNIRMKVAGYAELGKRQQSNLDSDKAFVAMWYSEEKYPMKDIYKNHIEPGIWNAGYRPIRIDFKPHNNDIAAEILAEIRQSRFILADVTGQRPAVYYEAGFAKGLSLPVIWMVNEDEIKDCAFNTEHFSHIKWKLNDSDLSKRITDWIIGTIEQGPLKPE